MIIKNGKDDAVDTVNTANTVDTTVRVRTVKGGEGLFYSPDVLPRLSDRDGAFRPKCVFE